MRIQKYLPRGLECDTLGDYAYLSIIPFAMKDIRLPLLPPLPYSSLWELNLRTYVKYKGKKGIYFFTLDTDHPLGQWIAVTFFNLPYRLRRMEGQVLEKNEFTENFLFHSKNSFFVDAIIGEKLVPNNEDLWLTERYSLFTAGKNGLYRGDVVHRPWQLKKVKKFKMEDRFSCQFGFDNSLDFFKASYSEGINVFFKPFIFLG